ncbi:Cu2+-exporting ATPase [Sphingobium jiangsuense]|uniref:Cu2+-exporting ATPase n=3 Tax=Sphingobium jiangsuense TaxID=870476 RepID=A0A7W6BIS9_9SPHN|nr:heavy metal translocating P-type ATPase [Sphingobium jiangsuense]MBB3926719.1 Cu2+-exporting ATPase [Sphingobium jiangsuense]
MTALPNHSEFLLPGIRCAGCIAKIEQGLAKTPGVHAARVNFTARRVAIDHDAALDMQALRDELGALGFTAEPVIEKGAPSPAEAKEDQRLLRALGVSGFAAMNVMLLSVSVWSGAEGATRQMFHWLSALIAMPTVAYAGRPFFRSAWGALRRGRTNMDVPISIGILLATAMSLFETIVDGPHAYFDGAVSLIFFLLAGRVLDDAMRKRARGDAAALLRETAPGGMVLRSDGRTEWLRADRIEPGMRLLVGMGERFAADGTVEEGETAVDRSLVTGESAPERVRRGGRAYAGTLNMDAPVILRVTAAGPDTAMAEMARLMEAAGGAKSRYVRIADRAARYYAPAVHSLAALSFAGWMIAGAGWHQSLLIAVAVLIITCPCALGLAVPVAQVVVSGALMRRGILVKDGSALERMAEADRICLDKTGTLTLGRPELIEPADLDPHTAGIALALARASRHPLARALTGALEARGVAAAVVENITEVPGMGVEAAMQGRRVRLGRPGWAEKLPVEGKALACALMVEGEAPLLFRFADRLRPGAQAAVARLAAQGLHPLILSGDRAAAVEAAAREVGAEGKGDLSPADKLAAIRALGEAGHKVLMVGDGLNDGPALASGHVSMAPASASDVSQTAADILFLGDSLEPVPVAVDAARRTLRVVKQNFAIAIGYNVFAVPLAMAGLVTPLVAALSMSASSILVIGNALKLRVIAKQAATPAGPAIAVAKKAGSAQ